MNHSITLVNSAFGVYVAHPSPPLGIAYINAALRGKGIRCVLIDETAGMDASGQGILGVGKT